MSLGSATGVGTPDEGLKSEEAVVWALITVGVETTANGVGLDGRLLSTLDASEMGVIAGAS